MTREQAISEMRKAAAKVVGRPLVDQELHTNTGPHITMQYSEGLNDMRSDYELGNGKFCCVQFYGGSSNIAKAWVE